MSILTSLKNWFMRGGAKLGMTKSLTQITDDERVAIDPSEYTRIQTAKRYYKDDLPLIHYRNSYGQRRRRPMSTLNVTKLASKRLASIVFNEQCELSVKNATVNKFINDVISKNRFNLQFEQHLETGIALGGVAARPFVDDQNNIRIAWANADQFYPLQNNTDNISECVFASRSTRIENKQPIYYTLLEFHQWDGPDTYTVTNELYRSTTRDVVGNQVPLNMVYPNLQDQVQFTGGAIKKPLFAYFRTPGTNNKDLDSPLGVGIVDNSQNIIDAINRTHDQFVHEVRMGKRRIAVPAEMLRPQTAFGSGQGDQVHPPLFDPEMDVYEAMYGDPDSLKITDLTSDIRADQFKASIDYFLREFESQTGVSAGTFSFDGEGVKTATEVVSENSTTYQTRSSYTTQVELFLNQLVTAILELASTPQFFNDGQARITGYDADAELGLSVHFDDGVFVDKDKQRTDELQLVTANVMPKKQYLIRNYGLSESEADEWLSEVDSEQPSFGGNAFETGLNPSGDENVGAE